MGDDRPVPDWLLERLARGELPDAEADRLRARLEARGEGARLQALEQSDREILNDYPPAVVAAEVNRRSQRPRSGPVTVAWRPALFTGFALGAAGLAVVFALVRQPGQPAGSLAAHFPGDPEVTTARGLTPRLAVYRKLDKRAERLADGSSARRGDVLQLAYVAAGRRYGLIASVDAENTVTLHLPEKAGPAARLQSGKEIALPSAYELDATPGFERFVFVTSDEPFDSGAVLESLRAEGPSLPVGLSMTVVTVTKASP